MIKKAVLTLTIAPFLMVFSDHSFAQTDDEERDLIGEYKPDALRSDHPLNNGAGNKSCPSSIKDKPFLYSSFSGDRLRCQYGMLGVRPETGNVFLYNDTYLYIELDQMFPELTYGSFYLDIQADNTLLPKMTDEECKSKSGGTFSGSASSANYLSSGGSVKTSGGACSVSSGGGVTACTGTDNNVTCSVPIVATSTGEYGNYVEGEYIDSLGDGGTFSVVDFNTPDYLNELPGGCSDSSSCVTIGDTSYLVDWDSAPDYFSYVDSNGTTHSKPSSGGGGDTGGGDNGGGDPTDPTDPTDPGGDNGGDTGGDNGGGDDSDDDNDNGGSDGGSTVPDFEFDESGIIEAIRSSGQSNRNSIDALSNDVTGAISQQTEDFITISNNASDNLNLQIGHQTDDLTDALSDQTSGVTDAIDSQTGTITDSLDALGTTFTDALKGLGLGSVGDGTDDGEGDGEGEGEDGEDGEDGEGDGLLGGISKLLNRMVDKLASRFTEDLGDGNDLFDSSGLDETLDGVATQEQEYTGEVNALMDEIGEGDTSGIADQITSRLPSLPFGGCTPLQFGPMEISCQAFNTIKLWLTWIIYFWTVVSIVDTFFRSEQRTA